MIVAGIDMSKNSPGLCIRNDNDITFISFFRAKETKRNMAHFDSLRSVGVEIFLNERISTSKNYMMQEMWKVEDASILSKEIVARIPENVDVIGMEGFSYGSKGNSALDVAGYGYCVRKELFERFGKKMFVFSPGSVKKLAGKGNANKDDMKRFFLGTIDENLKKNAFWNALYENEIVYTKPVDDLIDAYFIEECAWNHLNKIINDEK